MNTNKKDDMKSEKKRDGDAQPELATAFCSEVDGLGRNIEPWMKEDFARIEAAGLWGPLKRYRRFRTESTRAIESLRNENYNLRKRLAAASPKYQWGVIKAVVDGDPERVKRAVALWERKSSPNA